MEFLQMIELAGYCRREVNIWAWDTECPEKLNSTITLNSPYNYKHSGDFGDMIYFLPAMKCNPGNLYIQASNFTNQPMTPQVCKNILPLLEAQDYIKSVKSYNNEPAIDCDLWRRNYNLQTNLAEVQLKALYVSLSILNEPWLRVAPRKVASCVVNRSMRHRNNFPFTDVKDDAIFIGSRLEYEDFCRYKKIDYLETKDLLEAARVIAGADLFVGNQSCCLAIAIGLYKSAIVELYPYAPNCVFKRENLKYY